MNPKQEIIETEAKAHVGLESEIISFLLDHNLLQLLAEEVCRIFESHYAQQHTPYNAGHAIDAHKRIISRLSSEFHYEWPYSKGINPLSSNHQTFPAKVSGQCICSCFIMPKDWPEHLKEVLTYLRHLKHRYKAAFDIIENEHIYGTFLQVHRGEPGILLNLNSDKIEKNTHLRLTEGCILHNGYTELMGDCFELTRQMLFKLRKDLLQSSDIIALLKKASYTHENIIGLA